MFLFILTLFRTIFTGVRRYRYVDRTYAFTKDEDELRRRNQQTYINFIKQRWHEKTVERFALQTLHFTF